MLFPFAYSGPVPTVYANWFAYAAPAAAPFSAIAALILGWRPYADLVDGVDARGIPNDLSVWTGLL